MDNPQRVATLVLAGIGAVFLSLKTFSFVRLLFSLFILPGKSVSKIGVILTHRQPLLVGTFQDMG